MAMCCSSVVLVDELSQRFFPEGLPLLFMIVEHFRNGDPKPVYERFRQRGRLAPDGLHYINSWVADDLTTCYQVMECDDRALLDQWIAAWNDIVECEVHSVVTSAEAAARVKLSHEIMTK